MSCLESRVSAALHETRRVHLLLFPVLVLLMSLALCAAAVADGPAPVGWYSGDMHVHRSCGGSPVPVSTIYDAMVAQDINVVSLLADMGNGEVKDPVTDLPLVSGLDDPISTTGRIVHWDAEWHWDATYTSYPHQALGGHLVNLGLTEAHTIWDESTYPIEQWVHRQGGITGFCHMQYLPAGFPSDLTCCTPIEYPVEVALGGADFIAEDVNGGDVAIDAYYRLLNCGFRPGLAAGTDYPCGQEIGPLVTFAQVAGGTLTYRGWVDAIARGRTVVSRAGSSQFLALTVDGTATPGDEIQLTAAGDVPVTVDWTVKASGPSGTIELVQDGTVIASATATPAPGDPGHLTTTAHFTQSGWLCARVMGSGGHVVHTAAVFVTVAHAPVRASATDAQFYVDWIDQLIANTSASESGVWSSFFPTERAAAQARYAAAKAVYQQIAAGTDLAPSVVSQLPADGATGVSIGASVNATFNEALDAATVTAGTFLLEVSATHAAVTGTVSYDAGLRTATLTPTGVLSPSTTYTATLKGSPAAPRIQDPAGTALAADVTWSFTTQGPDQTRPTVTTTVPASGATGVAASATVNATFSEALDPTTVGTATFELRDATPALVPATVSYNVSTRTATLTPNAPLTAGAYAVTLKGGDTGPSIRDLASNALAGDYDWSFTALDFNCPCTVWSAATVPGTVADPDGSANELGVKFRASVAGYITGVRFYKSTTNTGTHVGNLWNSGGTLLATATFTGESGSGWQEVSFGTPVAITAGTTYIASYHTNTGHYSEDDDYFTSGVDAGPLRALSDGQDGPNGVYAASATSVFPSSTYRSSNYWVDVVFATSIAPDHTAPTVASHLPASLATAVAVGTTVTATFSEALDPATVSGSTFELRAGSSAPVIATVTYDAGTRTATLAPSSALAYSTVYTAKLKGGSSDPTIRDLAGNALAADVSWTFTTADPPAPPPQEGPGGPILVISAASNPFSRYLVEILRAEGLNEFTAMDVSQVTATTLADYDVVILGEMALTVPQVSMLADWTALGGTLIAMRPDAQLAELLGITPAGGTLADKYLLVNTASGPGVGIVGQTIQFHGTADLYTLSGATSVATLYSDATTATANPAVTLRNVGSNGGRAMAFTYDLARSVVYTRQGNPAWAGTKRDGQIEPIRSDDQFYPDWIDFNKVAIPQADEQQRLLANAITLGNLHRKPLPRFWYLPKGLKAAIVMTGDNHGDTGMASRFEIYRTQSTAGCSVDDWECVRATGYEYLGAVFTDAQAVFYNSLGFEVALHVTTNCARATQSEYEAFASSQLAAFHTAFPDIPVPTTNRNHCIAWSDWSSVPEVEAAHGIRLDTNYYYWPGSWINNRSGMFTGSGIPMRFARLDGTIIDCYQASTEMPDESGESFPAFCDQLLDRANGTEGYYGVFTTNMHFDSSPHAGSDAVVGSAKAHGVPVVSAKQMLTWLDGRNGSSFGNLTWSGHTLSFSIAAAAGSRNLRAMLPTLAAVGQLTGITRNSAPIAYTTQTIKGIEYAFFPGDAGDYVATYLVDETAPLISGVAATARDDGTATVTWTTNEASSSKVEYGTDSGDLALNASDAALVTSHAVTLVGLAPSTTYHYRVTSVDAAANSATQPASPATLSFATPAPVCVVDQTAADFGLGTVDANTATTAMADGEVILKPVLDQTFSGTSLSAGWHAGTFQAGGTITVAGGFITVNGTHAVATTGVGPGTSLEFVATYTAGQNQTIGFSADTTFSASPWVVIGTGSATDGVYARSDDNQTGTRISATGAPHRYRIQWNTGDFAFYVDGALAATITKTVTANLFVQVSDYWPLDGYSLQADWLRAGPYPLSGSFLSRVFDMGGTAAWGAATWTADAPAGTSLALYVRTGNSPSPNGTWSDFKQVLPADPVVGGSTRYLQYRADLATTNVGVTPALLDVHVDCNTGPDVTDPVITSVTAVPGGDGVSAQIAWSTDEPADSRVDYGTAPDPLDRHVTAAPRVTSHSLGLTGLSAGTTYYYRVASADASNNTAVSPPTGSSPLSFATVTPPCFVDDAAAEFAAGTPGAATAVTATGNGEVRLKPSAWADFTALPPTSEWQGFAWGAGGAATVTDGQLSVDGARFNTEPATTTYGPGTTLEFVATFSAGASQLIGFGKGTDGTGNDGIFMTYPVVAFSNQGSGPALITRVWPEGGGGFADYTIPLSLLGAPHLYRIEWKDASLDFYVDGGLVHSEPLVVTTRMRPAVSDYVVGAPALVVDWIRAMPYLPAGSFLSRVFDAGASTTWGGLSWTATLPASTSLAMSVREGNSATPDGTWTSFAPLASSGGVIGGASHYLQYRADLATSDGQVTPALESVQIACGVGADHTPPVISGVTASPGAGGTTAAIAWSTNELATSRVDYGAGPEPFSLSVSDASLVGTHGLSLTGLTPGTTYHYRVTSADVATNSATEPPTGSSPLGFVTPTVPCPADVTAADFGLDALDANLYVAPVGDGEVILKPAEVDEFSGSTLPSGWTTSPWSGGTAGVSGGLLTVAGAIAESPTACNPGTSIEFVATFGAETSQHVGFESGGGGFSRYVMFSTLSTTNTIYARASDGGVAVGGAELIGSPHRYRIVWNTGSIDYYVDGVLKVTRAVTVAGPLYAMASDYTLAAPSLTVDWMRVSPYGAAGSLTSRVFDGYGPTNWGVVSWNGSAPPGASLAVNVRYGDSAIPDGNWTDFFPVTNGGAVWGNSRYIQYRADLGSTSPYVATPTLQDLAIACAAGSDLASPVISAVNASAAVDGQSATVTWTTNEFANSRVDYGTVPGVLTLNVSAGARVRSHSLALTGLTPGATYYYRVTSADASGNSATEPSPPAAPLSFVAPAPVCFLDQTVADFTGGVPGAGTYVGTYASLTSDGDVTLAPTSGAEMSGGTLPTGWQAAAWSGGTTPTLGNGLMTLNGGHAGTTATFGPGRSIEFVATFAAEANQHIGFTADFAFNSPWALFSTMTSTNTLYARVKDGSGGSTDTPISTTLLGSPHRYRIDWNVSSFAFYVDGALVTTITQTISTNMLAHASDLPAGSLTLSLDWLRVSPYAAAGTFRSRVYSAGATKSWVSASWNASLPSGTGLAMFVRGGNSADTTDASWSAWKAMAAPGGSVGLCASYAQYRADLWTSNTSTTPVLQDVSLTCGTPASAGSGVTDLASMPVTTGNDASGRTKVALTWSGGGGGGGVKVYRKGYGGYPSFPIGATWPPAIPATPAAAQAAGWTLTAVQSSGDTDQPPTRDYWSYVVFKLDACGGSSPVSNRTAGALDYLLGDVSDGTACSGNNLVNTLDVSLLGAHYGAVSPGAEYLACLDVGPTTDWSPASRPQPDGVVEFEDLVMFALNYTNAMAPLASARPASQTEGGAATRADAVALEVPALPGVGGTFAVALRATGAGDVHALKLELGYDRETVEMLGADAGELLARQGVPSVVLSPKPGRVDVALLGRDLGLYGEGELALVRFRVKAAGEAALVLKSVEARDGANRKVALDGSRPVAAAPTATSFAPAMPNPFNGTTTLSFALAQGGAVELTVYGVDGRKVVTLVKEAREAGQYRLAWNGRDGNGQPVRPGMFYARLVTPQGRFTRTLVLMK